MPTLADTLQQKQQKQLTRDANGNLVQQTPEEVQSLSQKAGLDSPPITPGGVGAIGGNSHQQKMAGTPQQKQAAISMATQPGASLQDVLRRQQERSQANTEEQGAIEKSQSMKELGSLGDRVTSMINAQKQNLVQAAPVQQQSTTEFQGQDITALKPLLDQYRANPEDMNALMQINQKLGRDPNSVLKPDEINQMYQSATDTIASGAAGNIDDHMTTGDLITRGNLGYSVDQLSQMLGVPADQLSKMSVGQLKDQITAVGQQEFQQTAQLQQKAHSGELGSAERSLASQGAREASRTGVASSEADVAHLEQQISNADQVQFGGKSYKVDDLLKDSTISGIVTDYMNSPEGSPVRQQLEQTEPGLISFIQKNQALLQNASTQMAAGSQQFQDIQASNKQLVQNLPENLARLVAPGAFGLSAEKIDPASHPLLQLAQQNPAVAEKLKGVADDDAKALSQLGAADIQNLEIDKPGGKWDQYLQEKKAYTDLKAKAAETTDPEQIMNLVFGGNYPGSYRSLDANYQKQRAATALGLPNSTDKFGNIIDADHDGHIDSPTVLRDAYVDSVGSPSLQGILGNQHMDMQTAQQGMKPPGDPAQDFNGEQNQIYDSLSKYLDNGKLDQKALERSGLSSDQLMHLGPDIPALKGHEKDLIGAVATNTIDEIEGPKDMHSLGDLLKARDQIVSQRGKLEQQFSSKGMQASDVQGAFVKELDSLQDAITRLGGDADKKKKPDNSLKATLGGRETGTPNSQMASSSRGKK